MKSHNPFAVLSDVLMLVLMSSLMMISMLMLIAHSAVVKHEGVKPDAQYLVILTWEDKRDVDLDLWLKDPDGNTIYFGNREDKNISLDRDSRGYLTNKSTVDGKDVISPNQEVTSIRAIIPGNFLVAVGYYTGGDGKPCPFKIQIVKVNPTYTVVYNKEFTIDKPKDAKNIVDFTVNTDGSISFNAVPDQSLIYEHGGGGMED